MRSNVLRLTACLTLLQAAFSAAQEFELRDGDRVVWIGGAFVERLQSRSYLETELTSCLLDRKVTFRNLGWSGDNVFGEVRAVFGKTEDGFQRLKRDLIQARPTVVLIAYGGNEAHRGEAGLAAFRSGLLRLMKTIEATKARQALVAPHNYEKKAPPLPDPAIYNRKLSQYRKIIADIARQRGVPIVDLSTMVQRLADVTDNGVHLTPQGYWRIAPLYARHFGAGRPKWTIDVKPGGSNVVASGTKVTDVSIDRQGIRFKAKDDVLPRPRPAKIGPAAWQQAPVLRVQGLPPGKYELRIDGTPRVAKTAEEWGRPKGVRLLRAAGDKQVEKLRRAIVFKNELYFHRYRPQNETYLFLFRKHEQGNNAVEVPQFEPLVKKLEADIARLRQPQVHTYRLVRIRG